MNCFVVIPTYNEKNNIAKLAEKIFALKIEGLRMVVVDDNSPDGTADEVKKMCGRFPIELIQREKKLGLGSAYIAGFIKALEIGADFVIQMDADLSHDPDDVPRLLAACNDPTLRDSSTRPMASVGMTIGSRKITGGKIIGWGWWRKFMSNGAMWAARKLLKLKTRDVTAGFRCWRCEALQKIGLETIASNGYAFQEEMLFRAEQANLKITEVPVVFVDREEGKSKLSRRDIIEFFMLMLKLRRARQKSLPAKVSPSSL